MLIDFDAAHAWAVEVSTLGRHSIHGPRHWMQVWENGRKLAEATAGADPDIVHLFALFHDCRRHSDGWDQDHGRRAAKAVEEIRAGLLAGLTNRQFGVLQHAMEIHNDGRTSKDPTVGCCWDADRLDLPRVHIRVRARFLSTRAAKQTLATTLRRR